ncbi:MAG: helix-turn-helix domain-containing protein [Bacteroides sp.]|nr:helix-turn-helix domain-containing protein [Bacillota bacterium]MCM1394173.1 helix-turn-helix domain-containing protein [[Eubacterium] siraeum]MCM1455444.1 helix-turn-helix domain-containing protein [Bacteroides sp.]
MIVLNQIRSNLQNAIKQSGLQQKEISEKIGISQATISQYMSGRAMPALDTFARLCVALDLDANEILQITSENKHIHKK